MKKKKKKASRGLEDVHEVVAARGISCDTGVSTYARWSLTIRDAAWDAPSMHGVNNNSGCKRRWEIPGPQPW